MRVPFGIKGNVIRVVYSVNLLMFKVQENTPLAEQVDGEGKMKWYREDALSLYEVNR